MCEWGTNVVLMLPDWWSDYRNNQSVSIDSCLADTMQGLWDHDVVTLGCCCGHGKSRPSIVLNNDPTMPDECRRALADIGDDRNWLLYQWQLVDVTKGPT